MKKWALVKIYKDGSSRFFMEDAWDDDRQPQEAADWLNACPTLSSDGLYYAIEVEDE